MSPALAIQAGVGLISGIAGIILLRRPANTPQGRYGTRIAGTMLLALCMFLTGFALLFAQLTAG